MSTIFIGLMVLGLLVAAIGGHYDDEIWVGAGLIMMAGALVALSVLSV